MKEMTKSLYMVETICWDLECACSNYVSTTYNIKDVENFTFNNSFGDNIKYSDAKSNQIDQAVRQCVSFKPCPTVLLPIRKLFIQDTQLHTIQSLQAIAMHKPLLLITHQPSILIRLLLAHINLAIN